MFTKNGHDVVKLSIEFSNWVYDINKTHNTKKMHTKIFYFVVSELSVYCCAVPFQNGTCNSGSSTSSSVDLYWLPTGGAIYYLITYTNLDGTTVMINISSPNVNVTSLTPGYLYTFYLQSFGAGGASNISNCSYPTCKLTFCDRSHNC